MKNLIIFGGTFDPIHNGHIRIAKYVSCQLNAEIVLVPAKNPRWKNPNASIEDRLNMIKAALNDEKNVNISIDDYEIKSNATINYTIDTVKYFLNQHQDKKIFLLIGADQVESFDKWKDAEEIARLVQIICIKRSNVLLKSENIKRFNIILLAFEKSGDISSKAIRTLKNLDTKKEVIRYIEEHNLYYMHDICSYYETKRFEHAKSVARVAYDIASYNHRLDTSECYIAGLLHDIGKKVENTKMEEIMKQYYSEYINKVPKTLYHQFVGAHLAKTILKIDNEIILDAIKFHATGKANMTPVGKIVYASDKVDPLRGYDSSELIKESYKNYDNGFKKILSENLKYLQERNLSFSNPLTEACIKQYLHKK